MSSSTPAYEWAFEGVFHKLLLNFTWWVNRKDSEERNVSEGGFLGLDNITVFDRSTVPLRVRSLMGSLPMIAIDVIETETLHALPVFKRRGVVPSVSCSAGKIIAMSSVHDAIPWAGHANYAASKGGVMLLYKSIAQELAPDRIRVNAVSPGAIRTPINTEAWQTEEAHDTLMRLVPYKRIGEPRDQPPGKTS